MNTKPLMQATPYIRDLGPFDTNCCRSRVKTAWAHILLPGFQESFWTLVKRYKILLGNCNSGYGFPVASASLGWDYFVVGSTLAIYPSCFCRVSFHLDHFSEQGYCLVLELPMPTQGTRMDLWLGEGCAVAAAGLQCCGSAHLVLNYIFNFFFPPK